MTSNNKLIVKDFSSKKSISLMHYPIEEAIGDVHPFYYQSKMYMYFLKTNGKYTADLLVSNDLFQYERQKLTTSDTHPVRTEYFVLSITEYNGYFYTFYGAGKHMGSSKSKDLIHWEYGDIEIPVTQFESARDPWVFYDPDKKKYRMICTAYRVKTADTMDCSIIISDTFEDKLEYWESKNRELIRYKNGYQGEPEVTQFIKINDRWYLFASLARRTKHHVGGLTYYMGNANQTIDEQDWQSKPEYTLDGEDLCAAQIIRIENKLYIYGWIPKEHSGNYWGGSLNIPQEVYQEENGVLRTKLPESLKTILSEKVLINQKNIKSNTIIHVNESKLYMEIVTKSQDFSVSIPGTNVIVEINHKHMAIKNNENIFSETIKVDASLNTLIIIIEQDIVESFLNDQTTLSARIDQLSKKGTFEVCSNDQLDFESIKVSYAGTSKK